MFLKCFFLDNTKVDGKIHHVEYWKSSTHIEYLNSQLSCAPWWWFLIFTRLQTWDVFLILVVLCWLLRPYTMKTVWYIHVALAGMLNFPTSIRCILCIISIFAHYMPKEHDTNFNMNWSVPMWRIIFTSYWSMLTLHHPCIWYRPTLFFSVCLIAPRTDLNNRTSLWDFLGILSHESE